MLSEPDGVGGTMITIKAEDVRVPDDPWARSWSHCLLPRLNAPSGDRPRRLPWATQPAAPQLSNLRGARLGVGTSLSMAT